jgi:hypothetical protein
MRCPVCGHQNPPNYHFCGACGRSPNGPRMGAEPGLAHPADTTTPLPAAHPFLPAPPLPAAELAPPAPQPPAPQPPGTAESAPPPFPPAWPGLESNGEPLPPRAAEPVSGGARPAGWPERDSTRPSQPPSATGATGGESLPPAWPELDLTLDPRPARAVEPAPAWPEVDLTLDALPPVTAGTGPAEIAPPPAWVAGAVPRQAPAGTRPAWWAVPRQPAPQQHQTRPELPDACPDLDSWPPPDWQPGHRAQPAEEPSHPEPPSPPAEAPPTPAPASWFTPANGPRCQPRLALGAARRSSTGRTNRASDTHRADRGSHTGSRNCPCRRTDHPTGFDRSGRADGAHLSHHTGEAGHKGKSDHPGRAGHAGHACLTGRGWCVGHAGAPPGGLRRLRGLLPTHSLDGASEGVRSPARGLGQENRPCLVSVR